MYWNSTELVSFLDVNWIPVTQVQKKYQLLRNPSDVLS